MRKVDPLGSLGRALLEIAGWAVLLYFPITFLTQAFAVDSDIFFHLKTGEWIAQHGSVPRSDPFSLYGQGRPLVAYSWLFEWFLFQLHSWFGLSNAVIFTRFSLFLAIVFFLYRSLRHAEVNGWLAFGFLGLGLLGFSPILYERPWLISLLFFLIVLDGLARHRESPRKLAWLPLVFLFWANLHINFVYGLVLLALALGEALYLFRAKKNEDGKAFKGLVVLSLLCFGATFLNPYLDGVYRTVFEYLDQKALFDRATMMEFSAPHFRDLSDWALLILALLGAYGFGRQKKIRLFEWASFLFACVVSFRSGRDRWCLPVTAIVLIAPLFRDAFNASPRISSRRAFATGSLGLVIILMIFGNRSGLFTKGFRIPDVFPRRAAAFLESKGYTGILYNPISFGGYLMWKLPKLTITVDARTNVHGAGRILEYARMMSTAADWDIDPDLERANFVVWPRLAPLTVRLQTSPLS